MPPLITLLTDFGTADGYVAEMKGVLASLAPGVPLLDLTHDIGAQDVEGGRLALARCWRRFPEGTVHLAVVDPGVGTSRAGLAVACDGRFLVGPDNGLLSPALLRGDARVVALPAPVGAAPTFHGRDLFAPAAAALAVGTPLESLGAPYQEPVLRRTPEARRLPDGSIAGVVMTVDRFGNAVTNLLGARGGVVEANGTSLPLRRTYGEAMAGEPIALVGSSGFVEIAVRDGSAAEALRLRRGDQVRLIH